MKINPQATIMLNKSEIFKAAHRMTKSERAKYPSLTQHYTYAQSFALMLSLAWKEAKGLDIHNIKLAA